MKKIIYLIILLLCVTIVTAKEQYKLNDIKCYGDMLIQINQVEGNTNYTFKNCVQTSDILWTCSCNVPPVLYNVLNETTTLSFRVQYNIGEPKVVTTPNPNNPSNDELYNQRLKRIITRTYTLSKTPIIDNTFNKFVDNIGSVITWVIVIVIIIIAGAIIIFIKIFKTDDEKPDIKTQKEIDDLIKKL